jgi:hypothetical protein
MDERIEDDGPLSQWSNEEVLDWQEWYEQLNQQKAMERSL